MPPVVAFVAVGLGVSASAAAFIIGIGVSLVISAITIALTPKPKIPSFGANLQNRTLNVREPISPRQIVYGRIRVGGVVTLIETSSTSNEFLHLILSVAGHPVEAIEDIYFDDVLVPLDGSGNATGNFAGLVTVTKGLGTTAGDAAFNAALQANIPSIWTSNHKQEGVAKLYVKLKYDRDKFTSIPAVTCIVKGKQVFDPRDSQTRWSPNAALCLRDYLTDATIGLGELAANINDTDWQAEANICEESVALLSQTDTFTVDTATDEITLDTDPLAISALATGNGVQLTTTGTLPAPLALATTYYWIPVRCGCPSDNNSAVGKLATTKANAIAGTAIVLTTTGTGVHTLDRQSELRYLCDGLLFTNTSHKNIIADLLSSCGGRLAYQSGQWNIYTAAFRSPTVFYDEDDTLAPIEAQTLLSKRDLINRARGVFADSDNNWKADDFPAVTNATYLTEDLNDELWADLDLNFTASSIGAQRLGKIEIERSRQQISFNFTTDLRGMLNKAGDVINYSNSRFGWVNKQFEVTRWNGLAFKNIDGVPTPTVSMDLRETASGIFDWSMGDETKVDLAPNTNLPDPNAVGVPENLTLASGTGQLFTAGDGTVISRILVSWDAPTGDFFVDRYEVDFKKNADSNWSSSITAHDERQMFLEPVEDGIGYDIRVRSVNISGAKSVYVPELNHLVSGKSDPPSKPDTFNITVEADGTRRYVWTHDLPEADVRSGGGYQIRWFLGSTSSWSAMQPLHDFNLINSPYTSNELGAGTYTFAIKSIDSTGNESTNAVFVDNVVLGNPRIANAILQRNEQIEGWDGFKYDCFINSENHLEATGSETWNDLPGTWAALNDTWAEIVANNSPISYTTPIIDLGRDFSVKPIVNLSAIGSVENGMMFGTDAEGSVSPTVDLVLNGDFATDLTSWTDADTGTGASTWSASRMRLNGGASGSAIRHQTISGLTIGNTYQVKFDVLTNLCDIAIDGDTYTDGAHLGFQQIQVGDNNVITFVAKETSATLVFRNNGNQNSDVDNVSMGVFDPLSLVTARYLQINVTVAGTTPILQTMVTIVDAPAQVETFEDIDTSQASAGLFERIAAGHFKIQTQGGISRITQAQITALQNSGAGFSWELLDKNAGFGADLVTNGDFPTDLTGWTDADTGTGVSSWVSAVMRLNGGASGNAIRHQTIAGLTIGRVYQIRFDVIGNALDLTVDGDTFGDGAHLPLKNYAVGTNYIIEFEAVETSATISFLNGQNNNADIDNVIMRDGRAAAEFKVYNATPTLADADIDILLRGARA